MSHGGHPSRAFVRGAKRAPQATQAVSTATPTPAPEATSTSYAQQIVADVPKSTIALAVVLSLLVLVVLGVCVAWRLRVRRRQRQSAATGLFSPSSSKSFDSEKHVGLESTGSVGSIEKPSPVFSPVPYKGDASWTPQIRNYRGVPLKNGELPQHVQAAREGRKFITSLKSEPSPPPPSYQANPALPPIPADTKEKIPTPPTPPMNKKLNVVVNTEFPPSRFSNPTPLLTPGFDDGTHAEPLPSPARTSSFAKHRRSVSSKHLSSVAPKITPVMARHSRNGSVTNQIRLMTVINTFRPSLDDELEIRIGECVRLVEEYHDGWCLVQHTGKADSPRGVVPRFCLSDRQPTTKGSRKRSLTLTQSAARK